MKNYSAEYVLNGLFYDVQRMIREQQEPKTVLKLIQKKLDFLQGKERTRWAYKIIWWDAKIRKIREEKTPEAVISLEDLEGEEEYGRY